MGKIYRRNCDYCGKYYEGFGKHFCGYSCKSKVQGFREGNRIQEGNKNFLGHRHTEKAKIIIGEKAKGNQKTLGKHWRLSNKTKEIMSENRKGAKNNNWRGGISFEPYSIDWTKTLKRSVRERDHYTCQLCGALQGDIAFDVHHIFYDKKNCNPEYLITLCHKCHTKTNFNRNYWMNYFQSFKK